MNYEAERALRAIRVVLQTAVGPDCAGKCSCLSMFDKCYDYIVEQNDAELINTIGLSIAENKCAGCIHP